jgi:DNA excision repair protein ERCC-4
MRRTNYLETIANKCVAACPEDGAQLVVLSIGMGLEILVHYLLSICGLTNKAKLRIVALPDHFLTDSGSARRFAEALALQQATTHMDGTAVHVFTEGTPPKDRCEAYATPGATVVLACRILCADLLHRRLSPGLVTVCVVPLPVSMSSSKLTSCARSVAFALEILLQSRGDCKLFVATDNPCSMAAACRGAKGGVLAQWRCSDVQLFPHIRVDVAEERMKRNGPTAGWTRSRTSMTKTTLALQQKFRKILTEVISELRVLERSHVPAADNAALRKRTREGVATGADGRPAWWEGTNPVGVDFASLTIEAVLSGTANGLEAKVKQAVRSPLPSLAPFRPLLKSLLDVRGLLALVSVAGAADFLLQLEECIVSRTADLVVHNDGSAAWTLSQSFPDVVSLAQARVYSLNTNVEAHASTQQTEPFVVEEMDIDETQIRAVPEEIAPKLTLLKNQVLSWCRSKRNSGEILVVVGSVKSLRRIINCLTHTHDDFARLELNSFLARYQNMYGVVPERHLRSTSDPSHSLSESAPQRMPISLFVPQAAESEKAQQQTEGEEDEPALLEESGDEGEAVRSAGIRNSIREINLSQGSCASSVGSCSASHHQILLSHPPLKLEQPQERNKGQRLELVMIEDRCALLVFPGRPCAVRIMCSQIIDAVALKELIQCPNGPKRIFVFESDLPFLRTVETYEQLYDSCDSVGLQLDLFEEHESVSDETRQLTLEQELQAIKSLGQLKAEITAELFCTYAARQRTAAELDSGTLQRRSRRGAASAASSDPVEGPVVVFDEREFRCSLPFELFRRSISVTPLTLRHGDYVLSPHHVVERKALTDLTQSLQCGRLHKQLAALARLYQFPILLIEFDRNIPFRLCYATVWRSTAFGRRVNVMLAKIAKIVSLLPRVAWVWSRSPAHSADMMLRWKTTFAKENMSVAESSLTSTCSEGATEATRVAVSVLSRFPGVTAANIQKVMQLCGSLQGLGAVSRESLISTIGEADGATLHSFLHQKL